MAFTRVRGRILDEVLCCPKGISFNRLASMLKGELSRAVLSREIKELSKAGFLKVIRDPAHKQRKIIIVENNIVKILNRLEKNRWSGSISVKKASQVASGYISTYRRLLEKATSPFIKDYLKHRALLCFKKILEEVV